MNWAGNGRQGQQEVFSTGLDEQRSYWELARVRRPRYPFRWFSTESNPAPSANQRGSQEGENEVQLQEGGLGSPIYSKGRGRGGHRGASQLISHGTIASVE